LANAACAIGNSSSFVRDAGFFGTPVVLVGNRQDGREAGANVIRVAPAQPQITAAATLQLRHGRYPACALYGDGHVSERFADAIIRMTPYVQKRLHYAFEHAYRAEAAKASAAD
jgi:prepilin-type processing-associated H-X9-DG protein